MNLVEVDGALAADAWVARARSSLEGEGTTVEAARKGHFCDASEMPGWMANTAKAVRGASSQYARLAMSTTAASAQLGFAIDVTPTFDE